MLSMSLKSLWARKLRLLMSTFAIVLGVAFVAGSLMFTDTLNRTFSGIMNGTVGDVVVRPSSAEGGHGTGSDARLLPASVLDQARKAPGAEQVDGVVTSVSAYVLDRNGRVIDGQGAPAFGINYHDAKAADGAQGLHVVSGHAPTKYGEIALDPNTVERGEYRLGDTVAIVTPGNPPRYEGKLVGTISYANGSMAGATLAAVDTSTAQRLFLDGKDAYSSLWAAAKPGTSQQQLLDQIRPTVPKGYEAVTGKKASDEAASAIKKGLSFITTFLLVFAGVALLVGSFIIVNTFGMLVMQRTKELALLRALGASARQVQTSILIEALLMGLIGSLVGIGVGVLLAKGIVALLASIGADLHMSDMVIAPRTILVAIAVGLIVTMLAAWLPARRASKIAPVTAMRDDHVEPEAQVARRSIIGIVLAVAGAVLIVLGVRSGASLWLMVAGMLLALVGIIAATPLLARPIVGVVRTVTRGRAVESQLASDNALRNPRRTAATASALMVGMALVSMMTVFGASASGSVDAMIAKEFRGDFVVGGVRGQAMPTSIAAQIAKVDGVKTVSAVQQGFGQANGTRTWVQGVNPDSYAQVERVSVESGSPALKQDSVLVAKETADFFKLSPGGTVTLTMDTVHAEKLKVAGVLSSDASFTSGFIVDTRTYAKIGGVAKDASISVLKEPGASSQQVQKSIERIIADVPTLSVKDQNAYAAEQRAPIDSMLMLIYGLLGLAIVIAALGVLNTLALSVLERTREIGLLRAIGLSRRQLRTMVRYESVAITLVGAVTGIVLGVLFGIAFQHSQSDSGVNVLVIPWLRLVIFLLLAILIGIFAAWWPARRASKLKILDAIATE